MKTLLTLIFSLILTTTAWAGNTGGNPLEVAAPKNGAANKAVERVQLNRGPFQTMSANYQGVSLRYQEGAQGANWAELSGGRLQWAKGGVKLSATPSLFLEQSGKAGVGANLQLQLSALVRVNHTSHLGGVQRHQTMVQVAPNAPVSAQLMRVSGPKGVVTRIGPSVKLGQGLRLWHGVATDDSHDLTLLTGNIRF